jgi:uncharacterized protein YhaN
MSAHTEFIISILEQQKPLEQKKKDIEIQLAELRGSQGGFRENRAQILALNQELTKVIKKLSTLHKAEVLATKKAMEEIEGGKYTITLDDVMEVGGTEDELGELDALLSRLSMIGGRKRRNRKTKKARRSRKN